MIDFQQAVRNLVRVALEEDIGPGDITSQACLVPERIKAVIRAKSEGVLSGLIPASLVFGAIDPATKFAPVQKDSDTFQPGDTIIKIEGYNQSLLIAERVALNFLAHLSGIATLTAQFVDAVKGTKCRILDTRKTTPGWRMLEKAAVVHGGGTNHRQGLYDMVLIKDNHIAAAGSIYKAILRTREFLAAPDFGPRFGRDGGQVEIEVEVSTPEQLEEAAACRVKRLLLDNQSPDQLQALVKLSRSLDQDIALEASGNVNLDNVTEIAATGVDYVSIGALTHSAPVADLSMQIVG